MTCGLEILLLLSKLGFLAAVLSYFLFICFCCCSGFDQS